MQIKEPRKRTPREIELTVLDRSRRRCALCFHLRGDLAEKHGQLAHLDDDRTNATEDNLSFLCLEHHSLFDSKTSQHKNYTIDEAKSARNRLYEAIEQGLHFSSPIPSALVGLREADRHTFDTFLKILPSSGAIHFMRDFSFGGSFQWDSLKDLKSVLWECVGPEYEFLDVELESHRRILITRIEAFCALLAENSFRLETRIDEAWYKVPQSWEFKEPGRWQEIVDGINDAAEEVVNAYDTLVREGRRKLLS